MEIDKKRKIQQKRQKLEELRRIRINCQNVRLI